ncbi:MAG: tetratricopeptide repeat protein, partial [Phycisphaerae bacterium]
SGAYRTDRLFTLETIDWGFMRPKLPDDRSLAYAQSEWMIEFIVERWGFDAVLALLKQFDEGRAQADAFQRVLKTDPTTFISDFRTWAARQITSWALSVALVKDAATLDKALQADPEDADLHAQRAEAAWLASDLDACEESARRALTLNREQPLALAAIGRVLLARARMFKADQKRWKASNAFVEAEEYLERLRAQDADHPDVLKGLAIIKQSTREWDAAQSHWEAYQKVQPRDPAGYRSLAGIHLKAGRRAAALPLLEEYYRLDRSDAAVPRQIGEIYMDRGDADSAARWFRRAVEAEAYDAELYRQWAKACRSGERWSEAIAAYQSLITLDPNDADALRALADCYEAQGDSAQAEPYRRRAAVLDGDAPADDNE